MLLAVELCLWLFNICECPFSTPIKSLSSCMPRLSQSGNTVQKCRAHAATGNVNAGYSGSEIWLRPAFPAL